MVGLLMSSTTPAASTAAHADGGRVSKEVSMCCNTLIIRVILGFNSLSAETSVDGDIHAG